MSSKNLLSKVRALGLPLLEVEELVDANRVLADVVKSRELRFWEGFPVLLANSAEKGRFDYERARSYLPQALQKNEFTSLILVSLALYKNIGLKFSWADRLSNLLSPDEKEQLKNYYMRFKKGHNLSVGNRDISSLRIKTIFNNYFRQKETELTSLLSIKDELKLEQALSCLFSPKQKELLLKKVRRKKLTKTEREYYSRVVKKKVLALANLHLHRLAQKLLEE